MGENKELLFEAFYKYLYNQYLYLCDGATGYRIKTSKLALEVVEQTKDIEPFLNLDQTIKVVISCFSDLDNERLNDVSKMLHLSANVVKTRMTMSDEMKKAIEDRRKNRKTLRLIKMKNDEIEKN